MNNRDLMEQLIEERQKSRQLEVTNRKSHNTLLLERDRNMRLVAQTAALAKEKEEIETEKKVGVILEILEILETLASSRLRAPPCPHRRPSFLPLS